MVNDICRAEYSLVMIFKFLSYVGALELISNKTKAGASLWISKRRGLEYWPTPAEEEKYRMRPKTLRRKSPDVVPVNIQIPQNFEKMLVKIFYTLAIEIHDH